MSGEYVAECLWPDVRESDLRALDARVEEALTRRAERGAVISYLGSLLVREDEIVLCQFAGDRDGVREIADAARIPYERILETARSPWPQRRGATGGIGF